MNLWSKTTLAVSLALTGKQALATSATVLAAGVTAAGLGADPLPYVIGAAGATVVYAYRKAATRAHALANGMISVFLGGVGAPYAGSLLAHYVDPVWSNHYLLAGVLSVVWPWAAPVVWRRAVAMFDALTAQPPGSSGPQP
jgi:MFS family permease